MTGAFRSSLVGSGRSRLGQAKDVKSNIQAQNAPARACEPREGKAGASRRAEAPGSPEAGKAAFLTSRYVYGNTDIRHLSPRIGIGVGVTIIARGRPVRSIMTSAAAAHETAIRCMPNVRVRHAVAVAGRRLASIESPGDQGRASGRRSGRHRRFHSDRFPQQIGPKMSCQQVNRHRKIHRNISRRET